MTSFSAERSLNPTSNIEIEKWKYSEATDNPQQCNTSVV